MDDQALAALAQAAGLSTRWQDFRGQQHVVSPETLRQLLGALEVSGDRQPGSGGNTVAVAAARKLPPLLTTVLGEPLLLDPASVAPGADFALRLEDGGERNGRIGVQDGRPALPAVEVPGYHRLHIGRQSLTLAVAPPRCMGLADLHGKATPPWASAAQLYGLTLRGDGGIGTYDALGHLATRLAGDGAAALAVSPVHALFSAEPAHRSPYSPSSRLLLNAMHVDPRQAFGAQAATQAAEALELVQALAHYESAALIDWAEAGRARLAILRHLFEQELPQRPELLAEFEAHRHQAGDALQDHACFETLHAHFLQQGIWSWKQWPAAYRDPRSAEVHRFAQEHAGTVRFHAFLQWLATRGLDAAQRSARDAGMSIGLIADLAIGSDPSGSHAWSRQAETLMGVSIGAPPDALAGQGQAWGLATLSPTAMREHGFAAFIELLRASMRHAGGIRIDHVMGLMRLWLVPDGAPPTEGAYLAYPWQDLLRLIALESWRHRCLVIGEDLGTVPDGFADTLAAHGVLGMSVLWFERGRDGGYTRASDWRPGSIAMTTTHDLPTAAGWWLGRDIEVRNELGLVDSAGELARQQAERETERERLWQAVHDYGHEGAVPPRPGNGSTDEFVEAAIAHVGRSSTAMAVVPLEDVLGLTDAPNVPGTSDEQPNWRRRLPADLDTLLDSRPARARIAALDAARRKRP